MRRLVMGLLSLLVAATVAADVRVLVRKDGSKVIYNVGGKTRTTGGDFQWLARQHDRRSSFDPYIEEYATRYRVDPVLVRAVIQVESDFNPRCVSKKGARGLMQLMPGTAKRYGVKDVHDPADNIRGGVRYLADLLRMFGDDLPRVLAAYNAGENAVLRYGGIPPYDETQTYVKRAMTVYNGRPYGSIAVSFAGMRHRGPKLGGGFAPSVDPLAVITPGMKYLGTR